MGSDDVRVVHRIRDKTKTKCGRNENYYVDFLFWRGWVKS